MANEKTVTVETIKYHTHAGKEYQVGDTYETDESAVASLATMGMAIRTDRVAVAKAQKTDAEKAAKAKPAAPAAKPAATLTKPARVAKPAAKKGRK